MVAAQDCPVCRVEEPAALICRLKVHSGAVCGRRPGVAGELVDRLLAGCCRRDAHAELSQEKDAENGGKLRYKNIRKVEGSDCELYICVAVLTMMRSERL